MMSKFINNIYRIHNNPFALTPLIIEFFRNIQPKPKNILLAYLVLPLTLNEVSRSNLKKAKSNSTIHTFCNKNENFFGLQTRIQAYKIMTNKCIQYAVDNELLNVNKDLSVEILCDPMIIADGLKDSAKASSNLYKIFKELDVVVIYRLLGIKGL
jgi:hypothetical protein